MMALTNVVAATQMLGRSDEVGVGVAVGVLILGMVMGAINGVLIVVTRVADIIVTLAMSFVWAGFALWILQAPAALATPVAGRPRHRRRSSVSGSQGRSSCWSIVVGVVWIPLRRSRYGLRSVRSRQQSTGRVP